MNIFLQFTLADNAFVVHMDGVAIHIYKYFCNLGSKFRKTVRGKSL